MTQSVNFITNIAIATGAGVGGVATFGASGSSDYCTVAMTKSSYFVCFADITTNRTSVSGVATSSAGGRGDY